jgi:putative heme-binding domain-containing protein
MRHFRLSALLVGRFQRRESLIVAVCLAGSMLLVRHGWRAVGLIPAGIASTARGDDAGVNRHYEQRALTQPGDPSRGRSLFLDEKRTKCATCHRVNGAGGQVGPDLSSIGGKFDRPHLIESLLEPSRQIVEGYRTSVVATVDGRVLTGIAKERSEQQITLLDAEGKPQVVSRKEIETSAESAVSLMPQNVAEALSPAEFTDLVAYLETLRTGGDAKFGAGVFGPIVVPEGFEVRTVTTGLTAATALEALPDGRLLVCEQTGAVRVIEDGRLLAEPFVTLPVDSAWERGVIGVTVDPAFPREPCVYVCWVARDPYPHHRVSRFRADGNVAAEGSEQVLLVGDDQRNMGGKVPAGHQGGALHFGADGKLYVAIGEQTAEEPSQRLDTFLGKLLRIDRDGSVPDDNPFVHETTGKYRAIWARGLRNPFTFAVNRRDGLMLINDVGGKFEEINVGRPGANYGWPVVEHGPHEGGEFLGPLHWYPQASISGGDFVPEGPDWPATYRGKYAFADFVHGWIKLLDPQHLESVEMFAAGLRRPVDLRFGADGSLYVLLRNAWVIDGKFEGGTGSVVGVSPLPPGT